MVKSTNNDAYHYAIFSSYLLTLLSLSLSLSLSSKYSPQRPALVLRQSVNHTLWTTIRSAETNANSKYRGM